MALGSDLLIKFEGGILHNIDQRHLLHFETTISHAIIHKENKQKMKMADLPPPNVTHINISLKPKLTYEIQLAALT